MKIMQESRLKLCIPIKISVEGLMNAEIILRHPQRRKNLVDRTDQKVPIASLVDLAHEVVVALK